MCHLWLFCFQKGNHVINIDIIIAQRDIDFIKQNELNFGIKDKLFCPMPAGLSGSNVAFTVLRFPGEPLKRRALKRLIGRLRGP